MEFMILNQKLLNNSLELKLKKKQDLKEKLLNHKNLLFQKKILLMNNKIIMKIYNNYKYDFLF